MDDVSGSADSDILLLISSTNPTSTNITAPAAEDTRCHYGSLTGTFGILVQFLLALIAFSCLIVKRFCEPVAQRRPWLVWFFDTSKQGVGAAIIHFANVIISSQTASDKSTDPCIWYVMNFLLDSTIGLIFIYIALQFINWIAKCCSCKFLRNGEYGEPAKCSRWLIQCIVYSIVMILEKGIVIALMTIPIWEKISKVIVSPIRNAQLELVLVMFVIPIVVNAIIFWVVDNFLMRTLRLPGSRSQLHKYKQLSSNDIEMDEQSYLSESSSKHDL